MAMEVSCGQCHGRLLVETPGVVVACPHCGTHLSIPAPSSVDVPPPINDPPPPAPDPQPEPQATHPADALPISRVDFATAEKSLVDPNSLAPAIDLNSSSVFELDDPNQKVGWHSAPKLHLSDTIPGEAAPQPDALPPVAEAALAAPEVMEPEVPPTPDAASNGSLQLSSTQHFSIGSPTTPVEAVPTADPAAPLTFGAAPTPLTLGAAPSSAPGPMVFGAASAATAPATSFPTFGAAPADGTADMPTFGAASVAPTGDSEAAAFADNQLLAKQKILTLLLVVIGSYASAVTIVLIYLLLFAGNSNLESLPDLKPPVNKNGEIGWQRNPPKNSLPWGHVLALGESRRFGNVVVTPLKVTRGSVKFEHFSGQKEMARTPTEPLLKLWVKFENASRNQAVVPLDPHLLFTRNVIGLGESVQANGFVAVEAERKLGKDPIFLFDMPILSEFRMIGQNLDQELQPGDSVDTFVPSDPEALNLQGDLVWRFQFRKGHNPRSQRGVTTLIDVKFNSKDVQDEQGA